MLTWDRPASRIAATTSGSMMDPPMEVPLAAALMRFLTPSCSYMFMVGLRLLFLG